LVAKDFCSKKASIIGSGEVFCKGNPSKQMTKVTGSGDITEKD